MTKSIHCPLVPDRSLQPLRRADGPVPAAADQQVRQGRDELQRQQRQPRHQALAQLQLTTKPLTKLTNQSQAVAAALGLRAHQEGPRRLLQEEGLQDQEVAKEGG